MQLRDCYERLRLLSKKRPIFHSEADFQHALAWDLHEHDLSSSVRLEKLESTNDGNFYVDISVSTQSGRIAFELKYKTRAIQVVVNGENFALKDQAAQDTGRYDFIKDVWRLERLVSQGVYTRGYAALLTNDSAYWASPRHENHAYGQFRVDEGRLLSGEMAWSVTASAGTMKRREAPHNLIGRYPIRWTDYSSVASKRYSTFRFILVEVAALPDSQT